jgi:ribosome-binding protein aMBF1 (putative translation factor)
MWLRVIVTAGGNKQHAGPAVNLARLEDETEQFKGASEGTCIDIVVNTVDKSVAKAITSGRQQKNMTQKELATVSNSI